MDLKSGGVRLVDFPNAVSDGFHILSRSDDVIHLHHHVPDLVPQDIVGPHQARLHLASDVVCLFLSTVYIHIACSASLITFWIFSTMSFRAYFALSFLDASSTVELKDLSPLTRSNISFFFPILNNLLFSSANSSSRFTVPLMNNASSAAIADQAQI
nr:hypothetical protein Iba_chr07aCG14710 [Ipomoea batatas]